MDRFSRIVPVLLFCARILYPADPVSLNRQGVEACNAGNFSKAVPLFDEALKSAPRDTIIRNNLCAAYRSLAQQQQQNGRTDGAVATLREALRQLPGCTALHDALTVLIVNQGTALLRNNDSEGAQRYSDEALHRDGENFAVRCLAGDVAYARHQLPKAREHWEAAKKIEPSNRNIIDRLQKLNRELVAERSFSQTEAAHFDIRFDYRALGNNVFDIRDYLMEAYNRVGQDLDLFPSYTVAVVLYRESDFRLVNNVPEFVAGLYDGKIRLPVNFSRYPLATIKGIIFHEYTHAIIHDLAGRSCPVWLNEGIAMREMNPYLPAAAGVLRQALASGATIPFDRLNDRATWNSPSLVNLAYAQSWMMAEYLFFRWSNSRTRNLLTRFKKGVPFTTILREEMNRTPEQFEEEWKKYALSRL